jgi:hypothetical protein
MSFWFSPRNQLGSAPEPMACVYRSAISGHRLALQHHAWSTRCPFTESTPECHMAAGKLMVDKADELYAVWDSKPARAYGGTADVVAYARERGIPRA